MKPYKNRIFRKYLFYSSFISILGAIAGTEEVFGGTNEFGSDWKDSLNTFKQAEKWTNQLGFVKMAHTEL